MLNKRILIIDDDEDILEALKLTMEAAGYSVQTSLDGNNIFKKISSFRPDLILLDILLSGTEGTLICQDIKSRDTTRHIPVILVSAHPYGDQYVSQYHADDFIEKPFEMNFLLNRIEEHLP